jgi:hypothetical protein
MKNKDITSAFQKDWRALLKKYDAYCYMEDIRNPWEYEPEMQMVVVFSDKISEEDMTISEDYIISN